MGSPGQSGVSPAAEAASAYVALIARLPYLAATARLTLCGMGATVDARVAMHDMAALLDAEAPAQAVSLATLLRDRAGRGVGGEVFVDWPGGAAWLAAHIPVRYALGGTGPQAAWVLAAAGAPALVALEDRGAHMVDRLDPRILLAQDDRLVAAGGVTPNGPRRPNVFIFEYTAGVPVGDVKPPRSSRIIVRFSNLGLEHDSAFDRLSVRLAASAGAALLSGFNAVPSADLAAETARCAALGCAWRAAGVAVVHLEMAGYDAPALAEAVLLGLRGVITSLGMSHSEFLASSSTPDLAAGMVALGERLMLSRICVHADHWAASATLGDPEIEREALLTGCLLASARAAAGHPVRPTRIDPAAEFQPAPFPTPRRHGAWSLVCCQAPYIAAPATTLGLGDSFTAGCLLVLGRGA